MSYFRPPVLGSVVVVCLMCFVFSGVVLCCAMDFFTDSACVDYFTDSACVFVFVCMCVLYPTDFFLLPFIGFV